MSKEEKGTWGKGQDYVMDFEWKIMLDQPDRPNVAADLIRGRKGIGTMLGILILRSKAGEFPRMRPVWVVEKDSV